MSLLRAQSHFRAFRELLGLLTRHRQLTWEMTRRQIVSLDTATLCLSLMTACERPTVHRSVS